MASRRHERTGSFKVVKVDSHKNVQTDIAAHFGNELADYMAGLAAARQQLPPLTLCDVEAMDKLQQEVAKHLVGCVEAIEERHQTEKWKRIPSSRAGTLHGGDHPPAGRHRGADTDVHGVRPIKVDGGRARPWLQAG